MSRKGLEVATIFKYEMITPPERSMARYSTQSYDEAQATRDRSRHAYEEARFVARSSLGTI